MKLLEIIKYSLFPRRCELCGEIVEINKARCGYCEFAVRTKGKSVDNKMYFEAVLAPFVFQDGIREGIHKFKYRGYEELSKAYAKEIARLVETEYKNVEFDLIAFVPMTKREQRERDYNQAKVLAKALSIELNIPCVNALKKIKETDTQQGKNHRERIKNIKDAFGVANFDVEGKTILLVDDVKTTGSTLNECSKALKRNKANKVYAVAIAATEG